MKNSLFISATVKTVLMVAVFACPNIATARLATVHSSDSAINSVTFLQADSTNDARIIKELILTERRQQQAAGLATAQSSDSKVKRMAETSGKTFAEMDSMLVALAKAKNIEVPMSKPEGGQKPDGRVDSAPVTLQDTTRNQQSAGEAANRKTPLAEKPTTDSILQLNKLKGKAFDQAYQQQYKTDNQRLAALLAEAAQSSHSGLKVLGETYSQKLKTLK
ncbi:hypothetical protein ACJVDH_10945 [Pedobacter sp. AW1-32]|uniref:hypothetical protein n=1 Tax=Pedobacter sp. AW1-32 TaxID=3383026 RepID=UPI003FEE9B72